MLHSALSGGGIDFPVAATAGRNGKMWIVNDGISRAML
jgi:hypothetical protein